jgi:hypothetical protein
MKIYPAGCLKRRTVIQACTNAGCQVALPIKFCTVALNVWGTCPHIFLLGPRILKWLRDVLENVLRSAQNTTDAGL